MLNGKPLIVTELVAPSMRRLIPAGTTHIFPGLVLSCMTDALAIPFRKRLRSVIVSEVIFPLPSRVIVAAEWLSQTETRRSR